MAKRPSTPVDEQPTSTTGPRELPLVALRETVIFPEMIVPLQVGREKSVNALNAAVADGGPIALVTQRIAEQGEAFVGKSASRHLFASHSRTSLPTASWADRIGTPLRDRGTPSASSRRGSRPRAGRR